MIIKRTLCCGDIHGGHRALVQCLERSGFNKEVDTLITLGDIVDGWSEVYECVEELLTIKNRIDIKGNHDDWFNTYLLYGQHPTGWLQGGKSTLNSYCKHLDKNAMSGTSAFMTNLLPSDIPKSHIDFFTNQKLYYRDHKNNIFVHGGFDRNQHLDYLEKFFPEDFYWDRDLWNKALSTNDNVKLRFQEEVNKVFIGHTATPYWDPTLNPMYSGGVWNLDQGAGWFGKLTIMNVDTEEYWQSDNVQDLYPEEKGRI